MRKIVEKFKAFSLMLMNGRLWSLISHDECLMELKAVRTPTTPPSLSPNMQLSRPSVAKLYTDGFQGSFVVSTVLVTLATLHAVFLWFLEGGRGGGRGVYPLDTLSLCHK